MVYSALQIITRGRDHGITVVGLGQQSKYDQKTCFYLVRQLTELDLVVKVRRGGVGTHFCIHKHFFDRNPSWKAIRDEETKAEDLEKKRENPETEMDEVTGDVDPSTLDFSPIDARHLSSLPLIRARVIKLLKASKNSIHASNNMLITLGFANPTKTDRRFFQSRIREMIQQGIIEKVIVPSNRKKSVNASVKCFRLVASDRNNQEGLVIPPEGGDDDEREEVGIGEQNGVKMNITIHKQISDLLEEAGSTGMTLNELSGSLCHFDKRTIELLLTRADKYPPPSHLSDLGIAGLMETSGRERRHRYYTVAAYRKLVAQEQLDRSSAGYSEIDFGSIGGFLPVGSDSFYEDETSLLKFQDAFKDTERSKSGKARKRPLKNPILPDGSVKQGRPRKHPVLEDNPLETAENRKRPRVASENSPDKGSRKKRKIESLNNTARDLEGGIEVAEPPKKRGRPRKDPKLPSVSSEPKKRGRPRKEPNPQIISIKLKKSEGPLKEKKSADDNEIKQVIPKKRGRPPKLRVEQPDRTDQSSSSSVETHSVAPVVTHGELIHLDYTLGEAQGSTEGISTSAPLHFPDEQVSSVNIPELGSSISQLSKPSSPPLSGKYDVVSQLLPSAPVSIPEDDDQERTDDNLLLSHVVGGPDISISEDMSQIGQGDFEADTGILSADSMSSMNILDGSGGDKVVDDMNERQATVIVNSISTPATEECMLVETQAQPIRSRARVNVSHLRRENELYRVIENLGGIVNIQTKEFFDAHMTLIESLATGGEATSAPVGTRTDKRTATKTLDNMERRGRIKQLKTSVTTHTGVNRQTCIAYLPNVNEERLNSFLADLARGIQLPPPQLGTFVKIDEHVEYGADSTTASRGALPLQLLQMEQPGNDRKERWSKNVARADQLFKYDDVTIREVLLAERTTLGQMYGFIVGKAIRARQLHLSTLKAFEESKFSSNIVSVEKRIVDLTFFCHDLPLGLYCSLVSSLSHDDTLTAFFASENGPQTLVRDLPAHIHSVLQIGRSRARSRFVDILETLRSLNLVTPLHPSSSSTPWISCDPNGDYPTHFELASNEGRTDNTPASYWYFNTVAPVHLWVLSETQPQLWKSVPLENYEDAVRYWDLLREACTNPQAGFGSLVEVTGAPLHANTSVGRSLRRTVSWNPEYVLTWHQMQYLKQFVDFSTGRTPLQEEDAQKKESELKKICWVTSAPQASVERYFSATHDKTHKEHEKARQRLLQQAARKKAKHAEEAKAALARKAEDARLHREQEWESLLQRSRPTPLEGAAAVRIERVRKRFLQTGSTKDVAKWEKEVRNALSEADLAAKKVLKVMKKKSTAPQPATVSFVPSSTAVGNRSESSVVELVERQIPLNDPARLQSRKRKRNGESHDDERKNLRRTRFQWNREYDELARDASAIIRARCRGLPRLDWAAFEQVFPAVPRNTVRQRLTHIKDTPGNLTYLTRLEDRWHSLWIKHRGTSLLPDNDPHSTSNFDLIKHIDFLRKHVDKEALRVGFVERKQPSEITIPGSPDEILLEFHVTEPLSTSPTWEFMWNATVEEGREKRLQRQAFTRSPEEFPIIRDPAAETALLAEAALKMAMGMPPERYDPELGSILLHSAGDNAVGDATKNLLNRGVLSKSQRDPTKQKPGRQLKISENNQNAIGGSLSRDLYQDAAAFSDLIPGEHNWHEWPLTATDGDNAALIQLTSDNQLEFKIDTTTPQAARVGLDWNSKKADDDQIETAIFVRYAVKNDNWGACSPLYC